MTAEAVTTVEKAKEYLSLFRKAEHVTLLALHFATAAGKIGNGLDEQLENFVREHPDTKLIIIDTMQKIREVGGEAYSYASDYEIIGRLKQFADKHCICVLTVHHTRKQPAAEKTPFVCVCTFSP